ncbi:hypothetical protein [Heyndrickxia coagulans]|jgi:hypothetical protein|uniref:hypothetical protein n=1 Tax=Heyndrickxia coagulans TaxID=1398 RepID=UPI0012BA72D9|nr:hypothetical protein [Heyndrickxia coagulans]MCR2846283.1 hypothetical protein [Heyndrickxia coagulans]
MKRGKIFNKPCFRQGLLNTWKFSHMHFQEISQAGGAQVTRKKRTPNPACPLQKEGAL